MKQGYSPFREACELGAIQEVKKLIEQKFSVNEYDLYGLAPLHYAAKYGRSDIVNLLIENGANENKEEKDEYFQYTPLHCAALYNHLDTVKVLLSYHTIIDSQSYLEETPLFLACSRGNYEVAKYLIEKGANRFLWDKAHQTPLHIASYNSHFDIIELLLENMEPSKQYRYIYMQTRSRKTAIDSAKISDGLNKNKIVNYIGNKSAEIEKLINVQHIFM
jgi:ankyrin repeat protein